MSEIYSTIVIQEINSGFIGSLRIQTVESDLNVKLTWDKNVINNEFYNKKKSKICCVYHKPSEFNYFLEKNEKNES